MKRQIVLTSNVVNFVEAVKNLLNRPFGVEGMGILYGEPGEGKSTVVAYTANRFDGVFIRANATWTTSVILQNISLELGGDYIGRKAQNMEFIVSKLLERQRIIFVDEADYLTRNQELFDTLRDIYDVTGCPVVLIGMEQLGRRIQKNGRFARRVTEWVEFKGLDISDVRKVADQLCEVKVEEELLLKIFEETKGNIGRIVTALSKAETVAKINKKESIGIDDVKNVSLFYDAPIFASNVNRRVKHI